MICPLCYADEECLEHLLFSCPFSRMVWSRIFIAQQSTRWALLREAGDLASRWNRTRGSVEGSVRVAIDICLAAICWELWKERNNRIFKDRCNGSVECGIIIRNTISQCSRILGEEIASERGIG